MFIYLIVCNDELAKEFTDESNKKCKKASMIIKDVVEKLEQGTVTVHDLDMLTFHKEKAMKLLPAVTSKFDANGVEELIDRRNLDVQKFTGYYSAVKLLLYYCEDIAEGTYYSHFIDLLF